jgi:hypothetical protein
MFLPSTLGATPTAGGAACITISAHPLILTLNPKPYLWLLTLRGKHQLYG